MSTVLSELQYNDNHLWVRNEGEGIFSVGFSDFAQTQLGDIIFMELPEEGDALITGDECAVAESVKTTSDIFSPISGDVVEVNNELIDSPSLINSDPYYDGWIFKLKGRDESELEELMSSDEYEEILPANEEEVFEEIEEEE